MVSLSIIIPTFNEAENVAELVQRIETTVSTDPGFSPETTEVIFVDDSTDDTPERVAHAARNSRMHVRCLHRDVPVAGLGGAVVEGLRLARHDLCVVMDGDLQHPPERLGALVKRMLETDADVVVASRYLRGGDAGGLAGALRHGVSIASTAIVKAMFPLRLRDCTDPMTGFFALHKPAIDIDSLKPQGFKILLEILARKTYRVAEVPFAFAGRRSGISKATWRQGLHFVRQLFTLRFGRMSGFALVGAVGALVNIALVWLLTGAGVGVFVSTLVAAEVTIISNFLFIDRFVFADLRPDARGFWSRLAQSFAFNNIEALIRIALVVWIVGREWMSATLATAMLLALAFIVRYVYHALIVYAPRRSPR